MRGSFVLPSGRRIRTRTKRRYIMVIDAERPDGGPPFVIHYDDVLSYCLQRRSRPTDVIVNTETGAWMR